MTPLEDLAARRGMSLDHLGGKAPEISQDITNQIEKIESFLRKSKQRIVTVWADSDCDGVTSAFLMDRILKDMGIFAYVRFTNRFVDGYGLPVTGVKHVAEKGIWTLIALDCGTNDIEAIEKAKEYGVDLIVIDHHPSLYVDAARPKMILNPEADMKGPGYCTASLAYMMAQAICPNAVDEKMTALAALGIVTDVAPLTGYNRSVVVAGLEAWGKVAGPWFPEDSYPVSTARDLAFGVGPLINAAGRMGQTVAAWDLLKAEPDRYADSLKRLEVLNVRRKSVQNKAIKEAMTNAKAMVQDHDPAILVVWSEKWHPGILGIIAGRLADRFDRPAIALKEHETGSMVGSGRAGPATDILKLLQGMDIPFKKLGGHKKAIGMTIGKEDRTRLQLACQKAKVDIEPLWYDWEVKLEDLGGDLMAEAKGLEPTGAGCPPARFLIRNLQATMISSKGRILHVLKGIADPNHHRLGVSDIPITGKRGLDVLVEAGRNYQQNNTDPLEVIAWREHVEESC